jgi:hypothetical protein
LYVAVHIPASHSRGNLEEGYPAEANSNRKIGVAARMTEMPRLSRPLDSIFGENSVDIFSKSAKLASAIVGFEEGTRAHIDIRSSFARAVLITPLLCVGAFH